VPSTVTNFSNQINVNFPVAGEDNDSQGFRSNFSRIQNAFLSASKELTELQTNSVSLNDQNDFGGSVIKRASFQSCSEQVKDRTDETTTTTFFVNYDEGTYQQFSITAPGDYVFTVDNWPDESLGRVGTIRLEITPTSTSTTTISFGGGNITLLATTWSLPLTYNQTTPIVWELIKSPSNSLGGAKILVWQLR
jgi:hypothetical protein